MGEKARLTRVVLDTNALVSALLFSGPSARLAELWRGGAVALLASGAMVREYGRVLAYPKFKLSAEEALGLLTEEVLPFVTPVEVSKVLPVIAEDPSDDEFLACALAGKADAIVSGDKHLLKLGDYRGIPVVSVRDFLERRGT